MANFLLQGIIYFFVLVTVDSYQLQFRGVHGSQTRCASSNVGFRKIANPTGKAPRSLSVAMDAISVPSALINQVGGPNWWTLTLLAATSSIGIVLEDTKIGAMLSSPLVTMGLGMILCNSGILPPASPVYSTVMKVSLKFTTIIQHFYHLTNYAQMVMLKLHLRYLCPSQSHFFCSMPIYRNVSRVLALC